MTMHTNKITAIIPYGDLKGITAQYLRHVGAIRDDQMITDVILPIEVSDDDNVTINIGLLEEGTVN